MRTLSFIISLETAKRNAVGPDNIQNCMLSDCALIIANRIIYIINNSIHKGYIPLEKNGIMVTPVPK